MHQCPLWSRQKLCHPGLLRRYRFSGPEGREEAQRYGVPMLADMGDAHPRTRIVGRRLDTITAIAHTKYAQEDLTKDLWRQNGD